MTQTTILAHFDKNPYPMMALVIEPTSVGEGEEVNIDLYGPYNTLMNDNPRILTPDGISMGTGALWVIGDTKVEDIEFVENNSFTVELPMRYIRWAKAKTTITKIENGTVVQLATRGSSVIRNLNVLGNMTVEWKDETSIYGAIEVGYYVIQSMKRWTWRAPLNIDGDTEMRLFYTLDTVFQQSFTVTVTDTDGSGDDIGDPDNPEGEDIVTHRDIVIKAVDACSDSPLPDTAIYIDDVYAGLTDENGLRPAKVKIGSHTVRMEGSGYITTDVDELDNEGIEVS